MRFLRREIREESAQVFFWLPVFLGIGIAIYFALPREPALWHGGVRAVFLLVLLLLVYVARKRLLFLLLMSGIGFMLMQHRAHQLEAPVWHGDEKPRWVHGTVERIEALPKGYRVLLKEVDVWQVPVEETPVRIRLKVYAASDDIQPGRRVAIRASLHTPARPAYPGGYDFARWAYFQQIGAVGFAVVPPRCLDCDSPPRQEWFGKNSFLSKKTREPLEKISAYVEKMRQTIMRRIQKAAGEDSAAEAAVAAALLAGFQANIPKAQLEDLRTSGLAHILSISGLHMVMVTMAIFFAIRRVLALIPPIALHYNTKKIAALAALLAGGFYLLLSGAPVPAQRAFIMIALFFMALLLDRVGITLRPLMWATLIVLFITPESITGASFQMSFAATFALIITFRRVVEGHMFGQKKTIISRLGVYISSLLLSSVVAGLATLPFALYHFGRIALYSVLANLCAVPLSSIIIMPAGMIALALMPFGLEAWPLAVMLQALEGMLWIASFCAALPSASLSLPHPSLGALLTLVMGALSTFLLRSHLRRIGAIFFIIGVVCLFVPPASPELIVHENAKLFAVKNAEGEYYFSSLQHARMAREEWAETMGVDTPFKLYGKKVSPARAAPWQCDEKGCALSVSKHYTVQLAREAGDAPCPPVDVFVQIGGATPRCKGKRYTAGAEILRKEGTHAFWLRKGHWQVKTVASERGRRLWTREQNRPKKGSKVTQARAAEPR